LIKDKRAKLDEVKSDFGMLKEKFTSERTKGLTEYRKVFKAFADKLKQDLKADFENQ